MTYNVFGGTLNPTTTTTTTTTTTFQQISAVAFELGLDQFIVVTFCGWFVFQIDKKRAVDEIDGKLWADAHGFLYFEVSALTGDGISDLFQVN